MPAHYQKTIGWELSLLKTTRTQQCTSLAQDPFLQSAANNAVKNTSALEQDTYFPVNSCLNAQMKSLINWLCKHFKAQLVLPA